MSESAWRNHSYSREDFRRDTFWDLDQTAASNHDWHFGYCDCPECMGYYDSYDYDFYIGDYYEWLEEMEIQGRILLSFEYECFGKSDVFDEKQAWCLNFTKTGRKKFIFSIDD